MAIVNKAQAIAACVDLENWIIAGSPDGPPVPVPIDIHNGPILSDWKQQPLPPVVPGRVSKLDQVWLNSQGVMINVFQTAIPLQFMAEPAGACIVSNEPTAYMNYLLCVGDSQDMRGKTLVWEVVVNAQETPQRRGLGFFFTSGDENISTPGIFSGEIADYNPFINGNGLYVACDMYNWVLENFDTRIPPTSNPGRFLADKMTVSRQGFPNANGTNADAVACAQHRIRVTLTQTSITIEEYDIPSAGTPILMCHGTMKFSAPLAASLCMAIEAMGGAWTYHTDIEAAWLALNMPEWTYFITQHNTDSRTWGNLLYRVA